MSFNSLHFFVGRNGGAVGGVDFSAAGLPAHRSRICRVGLKSWPCLHARPQRVVRPNIALGGNSLREGSDYVLQAAQQVVVGDDVHDVGVLSAHELEVELLLLREVAIPACKDDRLRVGDLDL